MTRPERLAFLVPVLQKWFAQHGRHELPWRTVGITPYAVWVSEIMLQQTQVARVVPYFERFLQRFPTVKSLAAASWEEFLPYYAGLGYYQRGRNMLKTALQVVTEFGGEFPDNEQQLRSLPGVGPYTAKAILSFGFSEPHLAFDTNQQRVFGRVLEGTKTARLDPLHIEKSLPPQTDFRLLNGAVMDFANDICTRVPKCSLCPLRTHCHYYETEGQLEEKAKKSKNEFPTQQAQVWLILHRQHQEYYSAHAERYHPFMLPAGVNTRAQIKEYFRRQYGLELAVRPPHQKGYLDEQPVILVNAQILLGQPTFPVMAKAEATPVLGQLSQELSDR